MRRGQRTRAPDSVPSSGPARQEQAETMAGTITDRRTDDLVARDRASVWHPYAAMPAVMDPVVVVGAEGVCLRLADGRSVVDGMSSWWAAIHGYRHPVLDEAVRRQLD